MPYSNNPLWPCAMTGAAACLSGFEDMAVIIHGSSGCYFYPASLLLNPIYGTHLIESDIIFGSEARIREVIQEVRPRYCAVAVVTTCVPSLVGEDLPSMLEGYADVVVDAAGFLGNFEEGYRAATHALGCRIDPERRGVNIDGLNPLDPFYRGNRREAERLLSLVHLAPATRFSADLLDSVYRAAPLTLSIDPDLSSSVGISAGNLLGFEETGRAFTVLQDHYPEMEIDPLMQELEQTGERIVRVCDKYLRRHDPPTVLIFGGASYAHFAADTLGRYLDAEVIAIGSRNEMVPGDYPQYHMLALPEIAAYINQEHPDLVLGSSYEQSVCGDAAFVPFTFPLRGRIALRTRTLAGPEGVLSLLEDVLNACMDRDKQK
ncbi:MAG: nitrogenase component 1 [Methanomicrobiales archaeon]|nr:nitrogenase component 1 [Methanomicrobiales archaeon]